MFATRIYTRPPINADEQVPNELWPRWRHSIARELLNVGISYPTLPSLVGDKAASALFSARGRGTSNGIGYSKRIDLGIAASSRGGSRSGTRPFWGGVHRHLVNQAATPLAFLVSPIFAEI